MLIIWTNFWRVVRVLDVYFADLLGFLCHSSETYRYFDLPFCSPGFLLSLCDYILES